MEGTLRRLSRHCCLVRFPTFMSNVQRVDENRNAPYVFGIRSAATAIATGNTTVIKSSEMTPRCYFVLAKAFKEAGLPDGVLNVVSCKREDVSLIVSTMIEHPAVRKINFTGSASTGRKIARACGENLKPCLMELGGKNSAVVLADADLEKAAGECLAGAFLNVSRTNTTGSGPLADTDRLAKFAWVLIVSFAIPPSRPSS
jgi:acyl-CoA reductase-like NAD-dependent aldehyde dehydrogenase